MNKWQSNNNPDRKRQRTGKDADVETALKTWFTSSRVCDVPLSGRVLLYIYTHMNTVLSWFLSYLDQRRQHMCHRGEQSALSIVQFSVMQGSVLGPLLFVMYTADVVNIVERQCLSAHKYADIQVYSRCRPNDSTSLFRDLGGCIEQVASWMGTNRLQLNAAKTEFTRRRHKFPSDQLAVSSVPVTPAAWYATSASTWTVTYQ